jgi:hypothetical protein
MSGLQQRVAAAVFSLVIERRGQSIWEMQNRRSAGVLPAVSICAPVGIRTPNLLIRRRSGAMRGRVVGTESDVAHPIRQLGCAWLCDWVAVRTAVDTDHWS